MFLLVAPEGYVPAIRIPVAYAGGDGEVPSEVPDVLGDHGQRSPGGTATATRRGTRLRLPCTTRPLTAEEATAARAVLEDPAGIYCAGDWLELLTGGYLMPAYVGEVRQKPVSLAAGRHLVLSFDLLQAGEIDYEPPDVPSAWWRGSLDLYTDIAKTTPPLLVTDRVRAWEDQEADAYTLQQPSGDAADVPFYSPAGMGEGLPSVNLNARPWMYSSEAGLVTPVSDTDVPWSAIIVATVPGGLDERYLFALQNTAVNNGLHALGVFPVDGVLRWRTLRREDGTPFAAAINGDPVTAGTYVIVYRFDGDSVEVWANGVLVLSGALNVATATFHDLIVGALGVDGNAEWSGLVAEVVYFPGVAIRPVTQVQFGGYFQPYLDA